MRICSVLFNKYFASYAWGYAEETNLNRPNYYIVLAYKDEFTGKNKTKWIITDISTKGNNKRLTNEKLQEVLSEYQEHGIVISKDVSFTVFIKEWPDNLRTCVHGFL